MSAEMWAALSGFASYLPFFLPLGAIGVWRWSVWLLKVLVGLRYRPVTTPWSATVSVISPVYNEKPDVFATALRSWAVNGPQEIIAVIDHSDAVSIEVFRKFSGDFPNAKLLITETPGKRPALADGVRAAQSEIVALVDSDTAWEAGLLPKILSPFHDPRVGGVATTQRVLSPETSAQKLFDIQLIQRYAVDMTFLASAGHVLRCLSGRTAVYRRAAILPLLDELVLETFWRTPVVSGEDKRLTYLIQAAGWHTVYQRDAHVFTSGAADLGTLFRQRLRWARNSWRADLRALGQRWTWRNPVFALYLIDNAIQPFTLLLGPTYLLLSLVQGFWLAAIFLPSWWMLSRFVRLLPSLRQEPRYVTLIPEHILTNIVFAVTRIFALFTLNTQGWITRWDASRLPGVQVFRVASGAVMTVLVCLGITAFAMTFPGGSVIEAFGFSPLPRSLLFVDGLLPREQGIPRAGGGIEERVAAAAVPPAPSISGREEPKVTYDAEERAIHVRGRDQSYTLAQIRSLLGPRRYLLAEGEPRVWILRANLRVRDGARLTIEGSEVEWLRLASNNRSFVSLRADDSTIVIRNTKVTSWDESRGAPDLNSTDGRSFIVARDGGRLDILDAEVAYLGYIPALAGLRGDASFGIAWKGTTSDSDQRARPATGSSMDSRIHHNAYGLYARSTANLTVRGNTLTANERYGVVLHEKTRNAAVEKNTLAGNGRAAILIAASDRNLVTHNVVRSTQLHGVILRDAHGNTIEGNHIRGVSGGIILRGSHRNLLSGNVLEGNGDGIVLDAGAEHNRVEVNSIDSQQEQGLVIREGADRNTIRGNMLQGNRQGVTVASRDNDLFDNRLTGGDVGITFTGRAVGNTLFANIVEGQRVSAVVVRTTADSKNFVGRNTLVSNRRNFSARFGW